MTYDDEDDRATPSAAQQAIGFGAVFGIAAAALYFVWTESGPARWLIDLQIDWWGGYYPKTTWLCLVLAGVALFALLALLFGRLRARL